MARCKQTDTTISAATAVTKKRRATLRSCSPFPPLLTSCACTHYCAGIASEVRKLPNFVPQLFEALMGFLLDVEDEPLWHGGDDIKHEEEGNGELFDSGQEYLDRISISLGGKALVPAAGALLPAARARAGERRWTSWRTTSRRASRPSSTSRRR